MRRHRPSSGQAHDSLHLRPTRLFRQVLKFSLSVLDLLDWFWTQDLICRPEAVDQDAPDVVYYGEAEGNQVVKVEPVREVVHE